MSPRTLVGLPIAALVMVAISCLTATAQSQPPLPLGFTARGWSDYASAEKTALAVPSPESTRALLRKLTEEPHVAGTPADLETAEFVRDKLREWGWKADLVEYPVLLNYPQVQSTKAEILRPNPQPLPLIEEAFVPDKDSASPDAWPAFHGYAASGTAEAQVVYANYGRPDDFKALQNLGIDVKNKIVLVRYGELFRGLKVYNAQKAGAAGVLIYSDPAEDGFARGDTYPDGPFRPATAIQRGSVQFLSHGPGDPTTPGWPSSTDGKRLPWDQLNGFPLLGQPGRPFAVSPVGMEPNENWETVTGLKRNEYFAAIPSLPLSYAAARPILEALGGPNVPAGWQGGLPFAYHAGPGPVEVRFSSFHSYKITPIWNVVATLPGEVEPDRWVLIGNHRDAWTYGAVDPGSGTAATLEACRALGEAVKNGWKPRRTLVYCSWDAEEYGLVGSTEWVEDHLAELDQKALLLLNVDSAVSGPDLDLDGVPSLRDFMLQAASAVTDPRNGQPLDNLWLTRQRAAWAADAPIDLDNSIWTTDNTDTPPTTPSPEFQPQMNPLGSGSDYTAFLDHAGVPAVDVNFSGRYGVYHAVYDNFFWMDRFGDPGFFTHAAAARLYTVIAMRAASTQLAPLTFSPYAHALRDHVDDLRRTLVRNARATRPGQIVPANLAPLVQAVRRFQQAAISLDTATAALAAEDNPAPDRLEAVNLGLARVERAFLNPAGLPNRPWFKHTLFAPGFTTGYAAWPLPGVRQAITDDDPNLLDSQLPALVTALDAATAAMKSITTSASPAP